MEAAIKQSLRMTGTRLHCSRLGSLHMHATAGSCSTLQPCVDRQTIWPAVMLSLAHEQRIGSWYLGSSTKLVLTAGLIMHVIY